MIIFKYIVFFAEIANNFKLFLSRYCIYLKNEYNNTIKIKKENIWNTL